MKSDAPGLESLENEPDVSRIFPDVEHSLHVMMTPDFERPGVVTLMPSDSEGKICVSLNELATSSLTVVRLTRAVSVAVLTESALLEILNENDTNREGHSI